MRPASFVVLALAITGCATHVTSDEVMARLCGIPAGWDKLDDAPANARELLSLPASGNSTAADQGFVSGIATHDRWFGKGDSEFAYCRYQVVRGTCDWPNRTVKFRKDTFGWSAEQQLSTVCVSGAP